ncbi:hypothetical protein PAPHI01_0932 [Pancytospora philotis]|nr:hypothetical protein PAPHI01_0932 [Pancytospora philotis]
MLGVLAMMGSAYLGMCSSAGIVQNTMYTDPVILKVTQMPDGNGCWISMGLTRGHRVQGSPFLVDVKSDAASPPSNTQLEECDGQQRKRLEANVTAEHSWVHYAFKLRKQGESKWPIYLFIDKGALSSAACLGGMLSKPPICGISQSSILLLVFELAYDEKEGVYSAVVKDNSNIKVESS